MGTRTAGADVRDAHLCRCEYEQLRDNILREVKSL
eukprot:IDg12766t1